MLNSRLNLKEKTANTHNCDTEKARFIYSSYTFDIVSFF